MEIQQLQGEKTNAEARLSSSASWFYWIAGLSLINTAVALFGGNVSFIFGLGITQMVDGIALALVQEFGNTAIMIAIIINIIIALVFILFGKYAHKGYKWVFIVGMVFYTLDGLIFLIIADYLSIAFHLYVLYALYRGLKAIGDLKSINSRLGENPVEHSDESGDAPGDQLILDEGDEPIKEETEEEK